jgi:hypothetical protein
MIELSFLLWLSPSISDPADFFMPPSMDRFASFHIESRDRELTVKKLCISFEELQGAYQVERGIKEQKFYEGVTELFMRDELLSWHLDSLRVLQADYRNQAMGLRLQMTKQITDQEWSIYLEKLEKRSKKDSKKENKLIHHLNIALMEFIESTAPKFPIEKQAPLQIPMYGFKNEVMEHYRSFKKFDLYNHPSLRLRSATREDLEKVTERADLYTFGIYEELFDLRSYLRQHLTADQWFSIRGDLERLVLKMRKLSIQRY